MRFIFFMFVCVNFSYCFAEKNPMGYFYKYRCENAHPDIAALAVLEKQSCPPGFDDPQRSKDGKLPICTSRYRIISILDAVSDTLRKEYLDVENYPVGSDYLHRPILIFGKYKNGKIRIEEYEETREYFDPFNIETSIAGQGTDNELFLYMLVARTSDIYALHSIGTRYYPKNLDTRDSIYYNKYLIPEIKRYVEDAGKDFNKLWQRLTSKRTPVKTTNIKNGFAALGTICGVRPARDATKKQFYELSVAVETIFKNDAGIDSNITIYIDKKRLPPVWASCLPSITLAMTPFYLFGDIKNGSLIIESWGSTRDMFVFGDTIYDITMGLTFRELIAYFLPSNISFEKFEFGSIWDTDIHILMEYGDAPTHPRTDECHKKAIIEMAEEWETFFKNKQRHSNDRLSMVSVFQKFRCRGSVDSWELPPFSDVQFVSKNKKNACDKCRGFFYEKRGLWGKP